MSTYGIIFMGTPHQGSSAASMGQAFVNIASIFSPTNSRVIRNLQRDSELLQQQLQQFNVISQEFVTKFAYEEYSTPVAKGTSVLVVPRTSAVVPGQVDAEMIAIPADHVNMIRFESADNVGFNRVSGHLVLMVRKACNQPRREPEPPLARNTNVRESDAGSAPPGTQPQNLHASAEALGSEETQLAHVPRGDIVLSESRITKEMQTKLLCSLAYEGMLDPMTSIPMEADGTCNWIFTNEMYQRWESSENRDHVEVLWIKGHPGTGKSTLMRRAFRQAQEEHSSPVALTAAFFFSDQSPDRLHQSKTGFFRCILYQLLQQNRDLLYKVTKRFIDKFSGQGKVEWRDAELQRTARQVLKGLASKRIFIFVDSLDACEEDDLYDVKSFIIQSSDNALRADGCLKVFVSSRYYRQINIPQALIVSAEDGNRNDIDCYIRRACREEPALECVSEMLLDKAKGIFLWVVLVVRHVTRHCRGKSTKFLRDLVKQLPPKLEDIYVTLLQDIGPEEACQTRFLISVLLFSYEPWNLRCIHTGLCFTVRHFESVRDWEESSDFLETAVQRHEQIVDVSCGLVQATIPFERKEVVSRRDFTANKTTYQFIHGTVKDFFVNGRGLEWLHNTTDVDATKKAGHLVLAAALTRYLSTQEILKWVQNAGKSPGGWCESYLTSFGRSGSVRRNNTVSFVDPEDLDPVFDYAARHVFRHLVDASIQTSGLDGFSDIVGLTGLKILDVLESASDQNGFPYFLYTLPPWTDQGGYPLHYLDSQRVERALFTGKVSLRPYISAEGVQKL